MNDMPAFLSHVGLLMLTAMLLCADCGGAVCGWVNSAGRPGLLAIKGLLWWELTSKGMFTGLMHWHLTDWPSFSDTGLVSSLVSEM